MIPHQKLPSLQKMLIMIAMHNNGDVISFKNQEIYIHNNSFKRAMKELHDRKVVLIKQERKGNLYKLTDFGHKLGSDLYEYAR